MRAGIFFLSGLIYLFSFEDGIGLPAMFCMFGVVGINILLGIYSIDTLSVATAAATRHQCHYDHYRAIRDQTPTLSD